MKLIAFAATTHSQSINKQLVTYAAKLLDGVSVEVLDLNDYEMPLFSQDREAELGQPQQAKDFLKKIGDSDGLIISFAEHNGSYSAAYKSLFDWCSRIETKVYQGKPVVLLSTSPGGRGDASVLNLATQSMPHFNAEVKASLSIPSFFDNFDVENQCLKNPELDQKLKQALALLKS